MSEMIPSDISALIKKWVEEQRNGVRFPVPFEAAWTIAGYSRKDSAKRALKGLKEGKHFSTQEWKNGQRGRSSELIHLSCDAMKHLCLMANTSEGEAIRDYFIESEEKWQLVQEHHPEVAAEVEARRLLAQAQEMEALRLKAEIAKQEAIKAAAEEKALSLRHYVVTALPEAVQQKVLGYTEVKVVEYRDRIIHNDEVVNDGSTVLKWQLCERYGFKTRNGKPDYKALNKWLEKLPSEAFDLSVRFQENSELKREWLSQLDRIVGEGEHQRYIGE